MYLQGFGVSGYRSFGEHIALVGPCSKVTLIAGQNNSGKSNILSFMHRYLHALVEATSGTPRNWSLDPLDRHIGMDHQLTLALAEPLGSKAYQALVNEHKHRRPAGDLLEKIFASRSLSRGGDIAWFRYSGRATGGTLSVDQSLVDELLGEGVLSESEWRFLWAHLFKMSGGSQRDNWVPEVLHAISPAMSLAKELPQISIVPAIRSVVNKEGSADNHSGLGLVDRLQQLQNPDYHEQNKKQRFKNIVTFVRNVLSSDTAEIEIPHSKSTILVHMNNRTLPLESLGTGVHEVVILAAAATVLEKQIVCIEEPELHLHPLLQQKLVHYLLSKTSNQYFITTHSAHLLNTTNTSILHVRHTGTASTVEHVSTPKGRSQICVDLGYRASDLLQTNCVIWVEGPSDRIYLRHWLKAKDPELIEGTHFSIMFYGGRLLSHLSADDPDLAEFISLRMLNRYISIIMDSDKRTAFARLNATKMRIRAEFDRGPGFAWITKGREIENYIPRTMIKDAIREIDSAAARFGPDGVYDQALLYYRGRSRQPVPDIDKVRLARTIAQRPADLSVMDLEDRISAVVAFIREANNPPT